MGRAKSNYVQNAVMRLQHHLVADWWCSSPIWRQPCWCHGPGTKQSFTSSSFIVPKDLEARSPDFHNLPFPQVDHILPKSNRSQDTGQEYWQQHLRKSLVCSTMAEASLASMFSPCPTSRSATFKHMKLKRTLEWVLLKVLSTATCSHIAMWTKDAETLDADPKNQWWPLSSPNDQVRVVLELVKSFIPQRGASEVKSQAN